MVTIDEVYIHKGRLYHYTKSGSGWFVSNGTKFTWTYDPYEGLLAKANIFDLMATEYWEVEEGSKYEYRDAIKTIFRNDTTFEA